MYDNAVNCGANIGDSFSSCGSSCPAGYHATGYYCSLSCGDSCMYDNAVNCRRDGT
jgi:hypothetical protein